MANEETTLVHCAFMLTADLKRWLDQEAKEQDRSMSAELRQILTREAKRRNQQQQAQPTK